MARRYIREDLVLVYRANVKDILYLLHLRHEDFAQMLGVSRQAVSTMLTRPDLRLTCVQYLATLRALDECLMERDEDTDPKAKVARMLWNKLNDEYLENGLH